MTDIDPELLEAKRQAFNMCGTTDIIQAFEQIANERKAMLDLHARNTALVNHIRRLDDILRTASTIISGMTECMVFVSQSTRNALARYREQFPQAEKELQEALKL